MFFGCLPCCGDICDRTFDIGATGIDIAATFSFSQNEQPTHNGNTLNEVSVTADVDGTASITSNYYAFLSFPGSFSHTAYNIDGTAVSVGFAPDIQFEFLPNFVGFTVKFSSNSLGTALGVLNHAIQLWYWPCGNQSDKIGNRQANLSSNAAYRSVSANVSYATSTTVLAGGLSDTYTTTSRLTRGYLGGTAGNVPDSVNVLTTGSYSGLTYFLNYPTSQQTATKTAQFSQSLSITRFRFYNADGDYFEPFLNWFGSGYTAS